MTWTEADIPDLSGRTAVVTGANGGLGFQTALALAGAGAHVVLAARDPSKTAAAEARIRSGTPRRRWRWCRWTSAICRWCRPPRRRSWASTSAIDVLVNNAGVMAMPRRTTVDGFEMQLGVDHLGHWAFTAHLLPALLRAPAARVVTVTSTARLRGGPLTRPIRTCRQVPGVGGLRAGEDGQLPLRAGAASAVPPRRGRGVEPDRAPGAVEHRSAGAGGAGGWRRLGGGVLRGADGAGGHDAVRGRATAAAGRDRPSGEGRGALRAAVRLERPRRAAADPAPVRPAEADRRPVAGLRAGNGGTAGRRRLIPLASRPASSGLSAGTRRESPHPVGKARPRVDRSTDGRGGRHVVERGRCSTSSATMRRAAYRRAGAPAERGPAPGPGQGRRDGSGSPSEVFSSPDSYPRSRRSQRATGLSRRASWSPPGIRGVSRWRWTSTGRRPVRCSMSSARDGR